MPSILRQLLPAGAVILAMVSLTAGASIAKGLFPLIGPQGVTALRLAIGFVLLSLVFRPWQAKIGRHNAVSLIGYGASMGLLNLMFYFSIERIPLAIAIAIELMGPLLLAVASSRKAADFLWIALASVGLLLLIPITEHAASLDPVGVMFALAAGVFWALYIFFGKRASGSNGTATVAIGMGIAACVVAPFGIVEAGLDLLKAEILAVALVVAVLSSAFPYSLEMIGLRRLPISAYGTLSSAEPAVGAVVAFLLLDQRLSWLQLAAIVIIIGALIGAVLNRDSANAQDSAADVAPPIT